MSLPVSVLNTCMKHISLDKSQSGEDQTGDEEDKKAEEEQRFVVNINCDELNQMWVSNTVLQSRERLHQEWLEREKIAQEEFRLKREREEVAQKRKEEEEVT